MYKVWRMILWAFFQDHRIDGAMEIIRKAAIITNEKDF
jgi:hypothetical protein